MHDEQESDVQARAREIEVSTLPDKADADPEIPKPILGPVTDLEQLKLDVNRSFEVLADWLQEMLSKQTRIVAVERSGELSDLELNRVIQTILDSPTLSRVLAEQMVSEKIKAVMLEIQQAVVDINDRLDKYNSLYGRREHDKI